MDERAAIEDVIRRALAEDRASEDVTTLAIVPPGARGRARLIARTACVIAGMDAFEAAFRALDDGVVVDRAASDGDPVRPSTVVATVEGELRAILAAERTALNLIQRLSGIATLTRAFVDAAPGVEIRDTRKTTPGLRTLEKAAVRSGGGTNHRLDLAAAVLIKDNHIAAAGDVRTAVERVRAVRPGVWVEAECETLEQVAAAVAAGADEVLLDNMDPATLAEAVRVAGDRARTEASGGVTLESVADVAKTGVHAISVGALTHSAPAADLSLEVD